jgi:hypothetical protein
LQLHKCTGAVLVFIMDDFVIIGVYDGGELIVEFEVRMCLKLYLS